MVGNHHSKTFALLPPFRFTGDKNRLTELGRVRVLHKRTVMPYCIYKKKRKGPNDETTVKEYASLVGQTCAERMLLYRS